MTSQDACFDVDNDYFKNNLTDGQDELLGSCSGRRFGCHDVMLWCEAGL